MIQFNWIQFRQAQYSNLIKEEIIEGARGAQPGS
jgi:hypothetical protein